jgi:transport and Golgi organization protein 2
VMCNRDERHDRPPAYAPQPYCVGRRRAVFPVDPAGGGSWVGVNDAGLAVALLNRPGAATASQPISRGLVVTRLLECSDLRDVGVALERLNGSLYRPFHLIAVHSRCGIAATVQNGRLTARSLDLSAPSMRTSCSVNGPRASAARHALFRRMVRRAHGRLHAQRVFHTHRWTARPDISVTMMRADARTVSRTWIDLHRRGIAVSYESLDTVSVTPVRHVRL